MRPGESVVEDIDRSVLYFFGLHDLHAKDPCWVFTLFDLAEEVFNMVIRLGACQSLGSRAVHRFDTSFGSEMELDVDEASILDSSVNANEPCKICNTCLFVQGVRMHAKSVNVSQ